MTDILDQELAEIQSDTAPVNPLCWKLRPGTRVHISYDATVVSIVDGNRVLFARDKAPEVIVGVYLEHVDLKIIPPDVTPGCIMSAGGALWVIRKSNNKDSYRAQPVDLSGKLRTIPIEDFINRYPTAKVLFDPRGEQA